MVDHVLGQERKPAADFLFVAGVDVGGFADVDGDDHRGVGNRQGLGLLVAQLGPMVGLGLCVGDVIVGKLHEEKWEIALAPMLTPIGDERSEGMVIGFRMVGVGFALIPGDAADGVAEDGVDHAIEEEGGILVPFGGVFG